MRSRVLLPISVVSVVAAACGQPKPTVTVPAPRPTEPPLGATAAAAHPAPPAALDLAALAANQHVHGFTVAAVYTGATGKPLGARFIHDATHFVFDYLRIDTAPQGFLWVNTYPTSDKGEPHTQEHLLLGKGNRGRKFGSAEAMALATSSAFTDQWRTCYHFNTTAAPAVFWPVFEDQLDAMLNPDYTDEEIRREVRNFGVDKADDGTLRLEEKGTVYNEMTRAYESPEVALYRRLGQLVYGTTHPLALDSGGLPAAIRTMTPTDIRAFHAANYHLANMGMIAAFPSALALPDVLDHTAQILDREAAVTHRTGKVTTAADLPPPAPAAALGTTEVVDFPYATTAQPAPLALAWPADRTDLSLEDRLALDLFLDAVAGDAGTPLYQQLVDSKTRTLDTGATAVHFFASHDEGQPVFLQLDSVRADKLDTKTLAAVRALALHELDHLAHAPATDPEVVALNARVAARIIDLRRQLGKQLDTPPGFGKRGIGAEWMDLLLKAQRAPGFAKSLVFAPELDALARLVASPAANPWTERIARWHLADAQPFGVAAHASPALRKQIDQDRTARIAAELARLQAAYKTKTAKDTLAKLAVDEAAATAQIDEVTKQTPLPPLVDAPPMTRDPGLVYAERDLGTAHVLDATFDAMASARIQLAFRIDGVAPADEAYFALFPRLLSDVGVLDDQNQPISAAAVREKLRAEVLEVDVDWAASRRGNRIELVLAGAGSTPAETQRALAWLDRMMRAPDWRPENLPRLRDVVAQELGDLRRRTTNSEETWVTDPRDAWARQASTAYLHTQSFFTREHDIHRLRWMLEDPRDDAARAEAVAFLTALADAPKTLRTRAQLADLAKQLGGDKPTPRTQKLSPKAAAIARDAGHDLAELLAEIPDASLAHDWTYLATEMAADLQAGAPAALSALHRVQQGLFVQSKARIVVVGSKEHRAAVEPALAAFVGKLAEPLHKTVFPRATLGARPLFARLADHDAAAKTAQYVGLVAPSTSSGVFVNLAPSTSYADPTEARVVDYLASAAFSGHGAHSLFMKTWAAGLAYSNGAHPLLDRGELEYYAERCPLLPQTLRFVIGTLRAAIAAPPDANIARYAVAAAFDSRVADSYESRASAMSADLADGITPALVTAFRQQVLAQARRADLADALWKRVLAVYGQVMPGLAPAAPDATYFVIGPDKQLDAYADYLRTAVGKTTALHKIYPRDFWLPAAPPAQP